MPVKIAPDDRRIVDRADETTMTDTVFCYSCRKHHARAEVTLVQSKGVKRWRCLKSIAESRKSRDQRDIFGKETTAQNQAIRQRQSPHSLPRPVLELFGSLRGSAPPRVEGAM
jgi:hypothetical protein